MLRPKEKNYLAQLENIIGFMEMEAFVCEDKDDANLLMKQLRKENKLHRINVVHSTPPDPKRPDEQFKHPPNLPRNIDRVFLDEILGECPPAIRKHLCQKKKLHLIPVFSQDPGDSIRVTKYFVDLCR